MERVLYPVIALAMQWLSPRYNARMRFLEAQIRMLRSRIDTTRIVPTPAERSELLRLGGNLDHDVTEMLHVVQPETYRRWVRANRRGRMFRPAGRPRTPEAARRLVLRFAEENLLWGYRRIVGELKKLGIRIGPTTVRSILRDAGHHPAPDKGGSTPPVPWTTFVHANIDSMVSCDFFTKRISTMRGTIDAYVFVFIHLGTRKVYSSASTYHPDGPWIMQQARNASMWMEDQGIDPRFLIRDRDRKFPDEFDTFWKANGARCIKIPPRAPKANAFVETFIESLKRECLNFFLCFSRDQLDYIVKTWVDHYNTERPHRGIGMNNEVLDRRIQIDSHGRVRCKKQLGGIIKSYYRDAA